jgi:hypothetical protein
VLLGVANSMASNEELLLLFLFGRKSPKMEANEGAGDFGVLDTLVVVVVV